MSAFARRRLAACFAVIFLTAYGDGYSNPASGHQDGTGSPTATVNTGYVDVRIAPVNASRKIKVTKTYGFRFGWTPQAYAGRNALASTAPRCKIGWTGPHEVTSLHLRNNKSGKLSVVVTVLCS